MSNTYGDFFISVACGDMVSQTMSEQQSRQAYQELRDEISPLIEAIHQQQQWSTKDHFSVVD